MQQACFVHTSQRHSLQHVRLTVHVRHSPSARAQCPLCQRVPGVTQISWSLPSKQDFQVEVKNQRWGTLKFSNL